MTAGRHKHRIARLIVGAVLGAVIGFFLGFLAQINYPRVVEMLPYDYRDCWCLAVATPFGAILGLFVALIDRRGHIRSDDD